MNRKRFWWDFDCSDCSYIICNRAKWGWWRYWDRGPWLESRQFLEIELTVTANNNNTCGKRVGGFPMTRFNYSRISSLKFICQQFMIHKLWLLFILYWNCWAILLYRIFVIVISFFLAIHKIYRSAGTGTDRNSV